MIRSIISGGQTGADRGALDASIYCGVPHGGWCPKGRLAEDGAIPLKYALQEMRSKDYLKRTEQNVIDSDCTLIFTYGPPSRGTKRTLEFTAKHGKSCHLVDLKTMNGDQAVEGIISWLNGQIEEHEYPPPPRHPVLNVAGPRESNVPGIADKVCAIVVQVLIRSNPDCRRHYPMTTPDESGEAIPEVAELISESSDVPDDGQWKADSLRSLDNITSVVLDAVLFAARRHVVQLRKDGKTPYINHPLEVAQILSREGKVGDPEMLAAALLHDTVEDTDTSPEEIDRQFGPKVRILVMELTEDKSLPKAERRNQTIQHAETLSARAKQIKIADLIANVRSLKTAPPADWKEGDVLAYLSWADAVQKSCSGINRGLDEAYRVSSAALGQLRYYPGDEVQLREVEIECTGLDEETARAVFAMAVVAAGPNEDGKSYLGAITDHFEPQNVYAYRAPAVPCWFVRLSRAGPPFILDGTSFIVAITKDSMDVVGKWYESWG